jgi:hypothetical protein
MPKKPNYQFEKRQKELERKVRKEEKLKRRQERTADDENERPTEPADADRPLEA